MKLSRRHRREKKTLIIMSMLSQASVIAGDESCKMIVRGMGPCPDTQGKTLGNGAPADNDGWPGRRGKYSCDP